MNIIMIILTSIGLSLDAFSLSLAYGTNNLSNKEIIKISFTIGLFHFFMPILGLFFGKMILNFINIKTEIIVFVIFTYISISMMIDVFKNQNISIRNNFELFLFAIAVSIDSFTIGIVIKTITNNIIICSLFFSIFSFSFTYLGLKIGKFIYKSVGRKSNIIGSLILFIIAFYYLFK